MFTRCSASLQSCRRVSSVISVQKMQSVRSDARRNMPAITDAGQCSRGQNMQAPLPGGARSGLRFAENVKCGRPPCLGAIVSNGNGRNTSAHRQKHRDQQSYIPLLSIHRTTTSTGDWWCSRMPQDRVFKQRLSKRSQSNTRAPLAQIVFAKHPFDCRMGSHPS